MILNNRNILYNHFYGPFLNPEIKHLPQIHQNQIIITDRCLGKGAFGEVWSGVVKNDDGSEELVAIKVCYIWCHVLILCAAIFVCNPKLIS